MTPCNKLEVIGIVKPVMNDTVGQYFQVTSWGESHGPAVGVVVTGVPAGLALDLESMQHQLDRRKPGQSALTTPRKEQDKVQVLSGTYLGQTTGAPIMLLLPNEDARPQDYDVFATAYRPSHADYTYEARYGIRDPRGGGRSSARITAGWVAAGAIAQQLLKTAGVQVWSYVSQVGTVVTDLPYTAYTAQQVDTHAVRCPDAAKAAEMEALITQVRDEHDSVGGIITGVVQGTPAGWGAPVFKKLHAQLAHAILSINAVHGFEYGSGFAGATMRGSEHNDAFVNLGNRIGTTTNRSGGIQGGISNGEDIYFRVAFKPTATILQAQNTVNQAGDSISLPAKGRHDPCVLPRAVPIVDALTAITLADAMLGARLARV